MTFDQKVFANAEDLVEEMFQLENDTEFEGLLFILPKEERSFKTSMRHPEHFKFHRYAICVRRWGV